MTPQRCKACRSAIFYAVTSKGSLMSVDFEPVADGNVILDGTALDRRGISIHRAVVLGGADQPIGNPVRYVSHFATCPNAGRFRK